MRMIKTVLDTTKWLIGIVVLAANPNWPSSRHTRGHSIVGRWGVGLSRLIYLHYYHTQSIISLQHWLRPLWTLLDMTKMLNVVLAVSPNRPSSRRTRGHSIVGRWGDGLSRLIYLNYHPTQSIVSLQHWLRPLWTLLDTTKWSIVIVVLAASPNRPSSRHTRGCSIVFRWDDGLSRLIYLSYYPKQSIMGIQNRLGPLWTLLDTTKRSIVVLAANPNRPSSRHTRGHSIVDRWDDGLSRLIYLSYYPIQSIIGLQHGLMPLWTLLDTTKRSIVVLAANPNCPTWSQHTRGCSIVGRWGDSLNRRI
jgi:hypothetical protein